VDLYGARWPKDNQDLSSGIGEPTCAVDRFTKTAVIRSNNFIVDLWMSSLSSSRTYWLGVMNISISDGEGSVFMELRAASVSSADA